MKCLECGAKIAKLAHVCGRCGAWAPVENLLYATQDRSADAADAADGTAGGPAAAALHVGAGQQPPESAPDPGVDTAGLTEWAGARKFSTTRLRPGYDIDQVDAFLSAIRDTFLGIREPSLTPDEIRAKKFFTTRLRPGYDEEEVDAFLDEAEVKLAAAAEAGALRVGRLECGPESAEAAQVCARCAAPVPRNPADEITTECPYCGELLRHPVRERRKEFLQNTFMVAAFVLSVAGLIYLFAALHWTATGG
jgi:DivIVA domain-containing protein